MTNDHASGRPGCGQDPAVAAVIGGTTSVPEAAAALMPRTPKPEQYST
ncbi:hypothetical protein [Streptomyces mirabilis]